MTQDSETRFVDGLFVNADKYAPQDDQARFEALGVAPKRFFDVFLPLAIVFPVCRIGCCTTSPTKPR
jgi:hypothetical protein